MRPPALSIPEIFKCQAISRFLYKLTNIYLHKVQKIFNKYYRLLNFSVASKGKGKNLLNMKRWREKLRFQRLFRGVYTLREKLRISIKISLGYSAQFTCFRRISPSCIYSICSFVFYKNCTLLDIHVKNTFFDTDITMKGKKCQTNLYLRLQTSENLIICGIACVICRFSSTKRKLNT